MLFFAAATVALATLGVGHQPQLDQDGKFVALAYGNGGDVYFRASQDAGRTFAAPVKIATVPKLMLGRHRGPRVAIAGQTLLVTAIGGDGQLQVWRSGNRGKTWSGPSSINDANTSAREGLDGIAANAQGIVFATWLDDRGGNKQLFGAVSRDAGATWSKNVQIYTSPEEKGHVCECCHPSPLVTPAGEIYVMWRNFLNGSRDMWLAHSKDQGKTFEYSKLGRGTWPLNACPMDGGDLALDRSGKVLTVWRRDKEIYAATKNDPERLIANGKDANMNVDGAVVWIADGAVQLLRKGSSTPVTLAAAGSTPVITDSVVAWEQNGEIVTAPVQ